MSPSFMTRWISSRTVAAFSSGVGMRPHPFWGRHGPEPDRHRSVQPNATPSGNGRARQLWCVGAAPAGSGAEPARATAGREVGLLRGGLRRGRGELAGGVARAREEVHVDARDLVVAELDVARALAVVAGGSALLADPRDQVVGHDA